MSCGIIKTRGLTVDERIRMIRYQAEDLVFENFKLEVEQLHFATRKDIDKIGHDVKLAENGEPVV